MTTHPRPRCLHLPSPTLTSHSAQTLCDSFLLSSLPPSLSFFHSLLCKIRVSDGAIYTRAPQKKEDPVTCCVLNESSLLTGPYERFITGHHGSVYVNEYNSLISFVFCNWKKFQMVGATLVAQLVKNPPAV